MTEKILMSEKNIPDGILHDQDLCSVSFHNNLLTLSFDVHLFSDHKESEFCRRYKDFTKCHIKCGLADEFAGETFSCGDSCAELKTTANEKGLYKVRMVSIPEFVKIANAELEKRKDKDLLPWEYLYTYISPNVCSAVIELSVSVKYKGREYTMCSLNLQTTEIEYIWE